MSENAIRQTEEAMRGLLNGKFKNELMKCLNIFGQGLQKYEQQKQAVPELTTKPAATSTRRMRM